MSTIVPFPALTAPVTRHFRHRAILAAVATLLPALLPAQARTVDWPVNGGGPDANRHSALAQITPENVKRLQVAWTYDTRDAFPGSEMQANPIVIDGMLYATSPKVRVFALDAATGKELWSFDPSGGVATTRRFRQRGVTVFGDQLFITYRSGLWALNRRTGKPVLTFGDSGRVDLRAGLGRPVEGLGVSASSPGVVFEDLFIIGSTVGESLPSAPGDLRAYDIHTGALRWSFHTIPHPGEVGAETWSADSWKLSGGANAWSGVTIDRKNAMVFAATGSAAFDFYGANRIGDNLFANTILALDARTGRRIWHWQGIKHDLWDLDFPAAPTLVTVKRGAKDVDAIAQTTKTGHIWVLDRLTGESLFPVREFKVPRSSLDGEQAASTQRLPVLPKPLVRQTLTERDLTTRTPAAHAAALATFRQYPNRGLFNPPSLKGNIIFPGYDGGAEWGGPAFDPETGLLYVNTIEMAWLLKMIPRDDRSLYRNNCASCHRDNLAGTPGQIPSLVGIGERRTKEEIAAVIRNGAGRLSGFGGALEGGAIDDLVNFLITGKDANDRPGSNPFWMKYRNDGYTIFQDSGFYPAISPPWGSLTAVDLNTGAFRWRIPFGEYPQLAARGIRNTGTDNYGGPVVTTSGLLFIAATSWDNKIRAFDKRNGKLLWEATLPFAGAATPALYMVNGKEYLVIACGGGKNDAPSGGIYVAFALPAP